MGGRTLEFTEEELDDMVALYRRGWSTTRIAKRYDCLSGSVWSRLRARGVEFRHPRLRRRTACVTSHGYVKWGGSYVHRIVAEAWLGRPLREGEIVHHKNGDKTDNRPDNLEIFPTNADHMRSEHVDGWSRDGLKELVRMRLGGATMKEMADRFGRTMNGIKKQIRNMKDAGRIPDRDKRFILHSEDAA